MPRKKKKNDPNRIIDDDDFLLDAPRHTPQDLPRGLKIVVDPFKRQVEANPVTVVDSLTKSYLGNGRLPKWMKDKGRR
jgi:hypothetical protein